jgi:hypothetical protein
VFGFFAKKESGRDILESRKRECIVRAGPWTIHNIALGHGVTTMGIERNESNVTLERCMEALERRLRRAWHDVRALDIACLEGMYSIAMGEKGASVLGIEQSDLHLQRANFVKETLFLPNVAFMREDARNICLDKHGRFAIVLMHGILEQIETKDMSSFLKSVARVCSDMLYVDMRTELTPDCENIPWTSRENPKSVKLSLPSLKKILTHVGFTTIEELPSIEEQSTDRRFLIARK